MKDLRKRQGLTQQELAESASLHVQSFSQVERGQRQPTLDTLDRIAKALGVTAAKLLQVGEGRVTTEPSSSDKVRQLLAAWPVKDRDKLARVLIALRRLA